MPSIEFHIAMESVRGLQSLLSEEESLSLYSLYRQAYVGDCNSARGGMVGETALSKWDAWNARRGQTKEEASEEYIAYVEQLKAKYGHK